MKKFYPYCLIASLGVLLLSGCASYSASPLNSLGPDVVIHYAQDSEGGIAIVAKAFNKSDCKRYLDRDVIEQGYQPVQLYIQNNSNKDYAFTLNRISLPCARAEEVAEKVHTSTAGRATGYGAAAVLTCGLFAIPAIVDGVKSSNANTALDNDFSAKTARDQIIFRHSHFNKLLLVPTNEYQSRVTVTLMDLESNKPKTFDVTISG